MSMVDICVDLPSYSSSLTVSVPSKSSIRDVKLEISKTCPGQPRLEGQRLIWRGRLLSDDENVDNIWITDPRTVQLAVHPSAWTSPLSAEKLGPRSPLPTSSRATHGSYSTGQSNDKPAATGHSYQHQGLTYVLHQHQKALSCLSSGIQTSNELDNPELQRLISKNQVERNGWLWPSVLDEEFPSASEGGLSYEVASIDGQTYLRLLNTGARPNARQEHAIRVLTYSFPLLTTLPSPTPVGNVPPQPISVPPHVNQLLRQMGLPPLRVANNQMVEPIANQNNPAALNIRDIPVRPLLAPLMMLLLRSMLLLYFVAPARKPFIGILIFLWMLYEIWQPIRNGLRNGWDQRQQANNVGAAVAEQAQNAPVAVRNVGWQPGGNLLAHPNVMGGTLDQQLATVLDSVANMNIADEERLLNTVTETPTAEPSLGHKVVTFVGLLVSTLHPAIWNQRRVSLRRRERTIRTENNARNRLLSPPEGDEETRAAQRVNERLERRAPWVRRYMERVIDEDWVDDAD